MAPLNLPVGQTSITVRVQPVVLFSICDAYIRRNEGKDRVIGTLLGSISDGVVDIRECYAVPHNESMDQVLHTPVHSAPLQQLCYTSSAVDAWLTRWRWTLCITEPSLTCGGESMVKRE